MKIGVFDSGVGGQAVANTIHNSLPDHQVIYRDDAEHVPYGTRTVDEIKQFVVPILQSLVDDGCKVIVIACNTVSTNLITELRQIIPVPLVAMEPMVKPAAELTQSGVIAVCATPLTLSSRRYQWLKDEYATGLKVIEPDCSDWSRLIQTNTLEVKHVHEQIDQACQQGADVIVLGCTHYHWIEEIIRQEVAGRAVVLQPELPVLEQLKRVIERLA